MIYRLYLHVARLLTVSHGVADRSALVMLATLNTRLSAALLNQPVGLCHVLVSVMQTYLYIQLGVSAANMAPHVFDIISFAVDLLDSRDAVN